mmetsp:Transcript_7108/g.19091  ORF Transcript_7108/g.19091 Transcript_7108/m.19091 type:complete len:266 (+) Transcript_7108:128-925(+)
MSWPASTTSEHTAPNSIPRLVERGVCRVRLIVGSSCSAPAKNAFTCSCTQFRKASLPSSSSSAIQPRRPIFSWTGTGPLIKANAGLHSMMVRSWLMPSMITATSNAGLLFCPRGRSTPALTSAASVVPPRLRVPASVVVRVPGSLGLPLSPLRAESATLGTGLSSSGVGPRAGPALPEADGWVGASAIDGVLISCRRTLWRTAEMASTSPSWALRPRNSLAVDRSSTQRVHEALNSQPMCMARGVCRITLNLELFVALPALTSAT